MSKRKVPHVMYSTWPWLVGLPQYGTHGKAALAVSAWQSNFDCCSCGRASVGQLFVQPTYSPDGRRLHRIASG